MAATVILHFLSQFFENEKMENKRGRSAPSGRKPFPRRDTRSPDRSTEDESKDFDPQMSKPPIILMKPRRPDEEDEEWPTIGKAVTSIRSRQQTPSRTSSPQLAASAKDDSEAYTIKKPVSATSAASTAMTYQKSGGDSCKPNPASLSARSDQGSRTLRGGIRLITESMEWSETPLDYLLDQPDFMVIGIFGPQGVGKSTLLSMIGGNDPFDMYRQYIFRPASKECTETASHQTQGVQFYVTENRILLLDSQPILSPSVMDQLITNDRRYNYDYNTFENYIEIESLQIVSFLMQVCHVVIILVDYFVDANLLRFIQTCEMLKPSIPMSENPSGTDHYPNIVFVQNRAKREDFAVLSVKKKCQIIEKAFKDSNLLFTDGVSLKNSTYPFYQSLNDCRANYFVLPDMKPRGYKSESHSNYKGIPDYEVLLRDLRNQVLSLSRTSFGPTVQNEKNWFHFAARMWDLTRKSLLIAEYGRMLP